MKPTRSTRTLLTAAATSLALLAMQPAHAQTMPSPASPSTPGSSTKGMVRDADASHPLTMARVSALKGVDLFNAERKKIGEIDEVLIDPASGAVRQVIVGTGGILGIGDKKHAAAMTDLKLFSRAADDLKPVKGTLAQAPDALPPVEKSGRNTGVVDASKFIGTDIVDANGKTIGEIEDVVVDLPTGQSRYALVEFDKAWSPVDKLFAFRMQDMQPAKEKGKLQVSATKESLEQMPSIDRKLLDRNELSQLPAAN